ncbi:uncharacterized protein LOC123555619 [Mercenaria mercenaria]|uniref:uncharacterized protein LOC123555619 n=1 Tax=Mercenaria mercenaria TaxID=6596 RepID=UPI00234E743C|nr:uncharacterized protein LOC123555619 [Mercenaria mercenaria]
MTYFPKLLTICILACILGATTFFYVKKSVYIFDTNYFKINSVSRAALKETGSKQCKNCSEGVPNLIIQYGVGRTATTLQFQILCLMMAFLHEDEINDVGCYYNRRNLVKKYNVIKCHDISWYLTVKWSKWVFMTSNHALLSRRLNYMRGKIKDKNTTIPFIADIDLVSRRGHYIVHEYQRFFGISDEKMQHIVEYLRYWDVLRVCCGMQMSADWRNHLAPKAKYKQHHSYHSPTYPACEMYNISQVEHLLVNTYVFKKLSHIGSLRDVIGKTSTVDGILNGSYCERCNTNISKMHLKFNQNCA